MPLDYSAGHSKSTPIKQQHFKTILGTHLAVAGAILARSKRQGWRHEPRYVYFDLNAGPGVVGGHVGSPLIFLEMVTKLRMPFQAYFFEEDSAAALALGDNVRALAKRIGRPPGRVFICHGDCNERAAAAIVSLAPTTDRTFGLVYADPNNHQVPVDAITTLATHPRLRKLDVLVHVAGNAYKRARGRGYIDAELSRDIRKAGKDVLLIREPVSAWQWTFVLATNWIDGPKFAEIGLHPVDSPEGEVVERRINTALPKPRRRTEATPSISGTPDSELSEPLSSNGLAGAASVAAYALPPSHTTSAIPPGEPSTSQRTSLPSATDATASTTDAQIRWDGEGNCLQCGEPLLCEGCLSSADPIWVHFFCECWKHHPDPCRVDYSNSPEIPDWLREDGRICGECDGPVRCDSCGQTASSWWTFGVPYPCDCGSFTPTRCDACDAWYAPGAAEVFGEDN